MKIRLLICKDCHSIEELPDFHGHPDDDVLLENLLQAHEFPNGERHIGALADVEKDDWDDLNKQEGIKKRISAQFGAGGLTGFEPEFYASKSTYQEDAAKCFNDHRRTIPCIDYKSDKKRIGNPSKAGWQAGPKVYLCQFCPIESVVLTEKRKKRGMYDA